MSCSLARAKAKEKASIVKVVVFVKVVFVIPRVKDSVAERATEKAPTTMTTMNQTLRLVTMTSGLPKTKPMPSGEKEKAGKVKVKVKEGNGARAVAAAVAKSMGNPRRGREMTSDALTAEEKVTPLAIAPRKWCHMRSAPA